MVKIRLTRMGRTHLPFYRIIAIDSRSRRDGRTIETLGTYEPFKRVVTLKEEEILKWLNNGAQPTNTVKNILSEAGIIKKFVESKKALKTSNKKEAKPKQKQSINNTKKVSSKKATKK